MPETAGELEEDCLALEVPPAAQGLTSGWKGGGGAEMGLRGFAGSRVSRLSGRVPGGGGGCLGCQTGPGQRMSGSGEALRPGFSGDLGFQASAPSSLRVHLPTPYQNSTIRNSRCSLPRTQESGPPSCFLPLTESLLSYHHLRPRSIGPIPPSEPKSQDPKYFSS